MVLNVNFICSNLHIDVAVERYYFQHDDDWRFSDNSNLGLLRDFLDKNSYDVVAGCYETTDVGFFARLDKDSQPGTLLQHGFQHRGEVISIYVFEGRGSVRLAHLHCKLLAKGGAWYCSC